jgi:hypothetical protein
VQKLDISTSVSRKENETLHFDMVKVSVASTRTPLIESASTFGTSYVTQHLPDSSAHDIGNWNPFLI